MSRSYQEIGLTGEATEFLNRNCCQIPNGVCPKCGEVVSTEQDSEEYAFEDMFYGDGPRLRKYQLMDGRVAKEVVQTAPWDGGPMAFFCLEIDGKREFEWTEDEINEYYCEYC